MALTPEQVQTIKSTVPVLQAHGNAITSTFYSTLLKENPSLNAIFNQSNQANNHQAAALANSLYAYASHIDSLGVISPAIERICQKHVSLYIQPAHYDVVGTYLLRAMGDVLGDALTPEILEAWRVAYVQLAGIMIKREDGLYKEAGDWTDWREFRIAEKVPESKEITSFYLEPVDGEKLPKFLPGQYISVMTDVPALKYAQSRQYSLSDAPREARYRISVKKDLGLKVGDAEKPGYLSNVLHDEKNVGDVLKVSHPAGEFFLDPDEESDAPVVLLSAGVGITPMISILNALVAKKSTRKISFVHATRGSEVQAFSNHVSEAVQEHSNINAVIFNKKPAEGTVEGVDYKFKTRMDLDVLDGEKDLFLKDRQGAVYYICGPDSFMADIAKKLKSYGVDEKKINLELFGTGMPEA